MHCFESIKYQIPFGLFILKQFIRTNQQCTRWDVSNVSMQNIKQIGTIQN